MSYTALNLDELRRILREVAGEDDTTGLDAEIADVPFSELGYDSLALLELAGRVERDYRVRLADDTVVEARTPGDFVELVNLALAGER
ncbi:acyl carrier protein [Dactylosporangium sp. NPDC048998]|uniref:acyl carrier protein n=1 Tax=Dactylosporangium sp. NPDC048998 TaxID=3363976 RepID=UPI00371C7413